MRWDFRRVLLTGCALLMTVPLAGAETMTKGGPVLESREFGRATAVAVGSPLRVVKVKAPDAGQDEAFQLERFDVFAPGAKVTLHGRNGARVVDAPRNAYFRGAVEGRPDSRVFLTLREDGSAQGVVTDAEDTWLIGGDDVPAKALGAAPLEMRRVEPVLLKSSRGDGFECEQDQLPDAPPSYKSAEPGKDLTGAGFTEPLAGLSEAATALYSARVAVETDYEFYAKFNNVTNATNYVGNLIGYASTLYTAELRTSLLVQSVSLWTSPSDPWNQTTSMCGLMEFGRYWNVNKQGVSRTIAHFLSGRTTGGGVAWVGALCGGPFDAGASCTGIPTDAPWGGGYGFTANIKGTFNISSPTVMWDILAVSHEIGHNFNSPHTHCYGGIGGNASPIDSCYTGECGNRGCACGTAALPGPAGARTGTIMSYCHLTRNSYTDVALNFGTTHPYGVQPAREAARMNAYIDQVAASNPSCLALTAGAPLTSAIFSSGFEDGTPADWTAKTP
ncbi:MAG: M12 family metallo-peptidase [Thermoanaerobaculia bacterium]